MRNGLTCLKGHVNITLGKPVSEEILQMPKAPNKNAQYEEVAKFLDKKIYDGYVLYPINYVTADILSGTKRFENFYTKDDEKTVKDYIEEQSKKFTGDIELQKKMLMEIYANPVYNKLGR